MRILIVSDTHGDIDFFNEVITKEGRFDMVLHCGDGSGESDYFEKRADCPVYAVKGNCDIFSHESNTRIVTVAGKRLYMEHGVRICNYEKIEFDRFASDNKVDAIIYGHTHRQRIEKTDKVFIVNPGSLARPRDGGNSYVVLTIGNDGVMNFEGKRI